MAPSCMANLLFGVREYVGERSQYGVSLPLEVMYLREISAPRRRRLLFGLLARATKNPGGLSIDKFIVLSWSVIMDAQ